jgi:hypothetical protein
MDNVDALARAIDYLGATDLGDGRYAFKLPGDDSGICYIGGEYEMFCAAAPAPKGTLDPSFNVPDEGNLIEVKADWWTPTQQFAWYCWVLDDISGPHEMGKLRERSLGKLTDYEREVLPLLERGAHAAKITVDLTTGEEVLA